MLFGFGDGRQGDKLSEKEVEVEIFCVHKFFVFCSFLLLLYFFVGEDVCANIYLVNKHYPVNFFTSCQTPCKNIKFTCFTCLVI